MKSDCAHCRTEGNRSCDLCGNVVLRDHVGLDPEGRDVCAYCLPDDLLAPLPDDIAQMLAAKGLR